MRKINLNQTLNLPQEYNRDSIIKDLIAGLTIFAMLVPQGMAYAMLAGLPPVIGLYASTIPIIIYAFFASSRHLSVGPVAIASLLVLSGVSVYADPGTPEYVTLVLILTFMVGVIEFALGAVKAGFLVKFISHPVMNGYTSAAAIVIGLSQLNHLLGVDMGSYLQIQFLLSELSGKVEEIHLPTVLLAAGVITLLVVFRRISSKIPAALIALIVSIVVVRIFNLNERGVNIIGDVPSGFPGFSIPPFSIDAAGTLFLLAITIALIAFMESLAISQAIAEDEPYSVDPNKELRALGLANISGSFFGAYPVTGSFSRSAVNHQAGAVTQVSSLISAFAVMITLLLFTSYFYYLPNAALAAIIVAAVYRLIDIRALKYLFQVKPLDGWVWVVTFVITLIVGIKWGILTGIIVSLFLLLKRSARPDIVEIGYLEEEHEFRNLNRITEAKRLPDTLMLRIDSSLHFANIAHCEKEIRKLLNEDQERKWVVIDMSGVNDIDTVSVKVLESLMEDFEAEDRSIFLYANLKGSVRDTLHKAEWHTKYKDKTAYISMEQLLLKHGILQSKSKLMTNIMSNDDYMI